MADNDALDAALAQFNEGLKTQQAEEAAQRAVDKAERKKQQAASELKKLQSDANVSAEDKAAAEEAYRAAVEDFNKLRSGEAVEEEAAADDEPAEEEAVRTVVTGDVDVLVAVVVEVGVAEVQRPSRVMGKA